MAQSEEPGLAYDRSGTGPPLVLLHGLGSSRRVWDRIVQTLAESFDVVAVDLPGFVTRPLCRRARPHGPQCWQRRSVGCWVALELAGRRRTASVTLLAPAGLWSPSTPLHCKASVLASRWITRHAAGPLSRIMAYRWGRVLVLGQSHGRPSRMSVERARTTISAMGRCPGFEAAYAGTARGYSAERPVRPPSRWRSARGT
jgi:pimeloyl-ACP methyl ester carboxylesterase